MNREIDGEDGTDRAWEFEAKALRSIKDINHPNITKCLAAIRRGRHRYFMFPWANGSSLRHYWDATEQQGPTERLVFQAVQQLRGLADALHHLHCCVNTQAPEIPVPMGKESATNESAPDLSDPVNAKNIRHGDLKPENILRFLEDRDAGVGTLKIADMGLAKQHVLATQLRDKKTSMRYGTIRYEAPEAIAQSEKSRSRRYDIWSMGCITLEFIIWILYGNHALKEFYRQVEGDAKQSCQYFEFPAQSNTPVIHHVVLRWMDHIRQDPECSQDSAIRDLLNLVQDRLLVISLGGGSTSLSPEQSMLDVATPLVVTPGRATAAQFCSALDEILECPRPNYFFTGRERTNVMLPTKKMSHLSPKVHQPPRRNEGVPSRVDDYDALSQEIIPIHVRSDYAVS